LHREKKKRRRKKKLSVLRILRNALPFWKWPKIIALHFFTGFDFCEQPSVCLSSVVVFSHCCSINRIDIEYNGFADDESIIERRLERREWIKG
jgi:hypothetical protein